MPRNDQPLDAARARRSTKQDVLAEEEAVEKGAKDAMNPMQSAMEWLYSSANTLCLPSTEKFDDSYGTDDILVVRSETDQDTLALTEGDGSTEEGREVASAHGDDGSNNTRDDKVLGDDDRSNNSSTVEEKARSEPAEGNGKSGPARSAAEWFVNGLCTPMDEPNRPENEGKNEVDSDKEASQLLSGPASAWLQDMKDKWIPEAKENVTLKAQMEQLKRDMAAASARQERQKRDMVTEGAQQREDARKKEESGREEVRKMEELIRSLRADIEAERRMRDEAKRAALEQGRAKEAAESRIQAQSEALKEMEERWKSENRQNDDLKAHVAGLKKDIDSARAAQAKLDGKALEAKEKAEKKIQALKETLQKKEAKFQGRRLGWSNDKSIKKLKKSIAEAQAKQDVLDEEALRIKKEAEARIREKTAALEEMKRNWTAETDENAALKAQIARLTSDIAAAKAKQEALDLAKTEAVNEVRKVREEGDAKIRAQSESLAKMEKKLKAQTVQLMSDNREKQVLGMLNTRLRVARIEAQDQVKSREEGMKKMNDVIAGLQANIQTENQIQDEVGKEVNKKTKEIELLNDAQSKTIRDMEVNLNAGNLEVQSLGAEITTLKTEIGNAKSKQQTLDELNEYLADEALAAKVDAEAQIHEQTKALQAMEAKLKDGSQQNRSLKARVAHLENEENSAMKAQISQLKKGIAAAQSEQRALDAAKAAAADEALRARKKAEATIRAQTEALEKMEARLRLESEASSALNSRVARLESDKIELRKVLSTDRREKQKQIDSLREANIETEKKIRDEAEEEVQKKTKELKLLNKAQSKTIRDMEANLNKGNLEIQALGSEITKLKTEIDNAKSKQKTLDELNQYLSDEAEAAKADAEAQINVQTKALKSMEDKWKTESKQNTSLKACVNRLEKDIGAAQAKQDELDRKARKVKEEAEKKINAQAEVLKKTEAKLQSESKHNSKLDSKIKKLNKSIAEARAKQEALDKKAFQTKEEAEARIRERTASLEAMKGNLASEASENNAMKAQISQLRKDIAAAKAEQKALDAAKAQAAVEARMAREDAETKLKAQTEALEKMEARLRAESKASSTLNSQLLRLESDKMKLKIAMSIDQREKQEQIDTERKKREKIEKEVRERTKEKVDKEVRQKTKELQQLNEAQSKTIRQMEANLNSGNAVIVSLGIEITQLKNEISNAKSKQQSLDQLNKRVADRDRADKMEAEAHIKHQTMALQSLEANAKENNEMKAEIAQLRRDIAAAKAEQQVLDVAKAEAAREARKAREEAETKIKSQTEALERMEAKLKAETKASTTLNSQVAQLEDEKIALRKVLSIDRREKQKQIDALQVDIQTEKKIRDKVEKEVQEKTKEIEILNEAQSKTICDMEANLNAGNLEILALSSEITLLKAKVGDAAAKQLSLDELNEYRSDDAKAAKAKAEALIKEQTKALKSMEEKWKAESKQNASLKSRVTQLEKDIGNAQAKQDELDRKARKVKEEAEKKINAQAEVLKETEAKLNSESKHNSKLDAKIKKLNMSISDAQAKQKALDEKALRIKEEAEARIKEKTEALGEMKGNWTSEANENNAMKAQISQLRKDIEVAKAEQKALDAAKAQAADEARKAREQAEATIKAQTDALKKMEAKLIAETKARGIVENQVHEKTEEIELLNEAHSKTISKMEANLKAGNLEIMSLGAEISKLKTEISDAKSKQQTLDELNEYLSDEAKAAKADAEAKIYEQTKALKAMEANFKTESKQNASLKTRVTQLQKDISDAQTKQNELDKKARKVKKEAEKKIAAQAEALKNTEEKLQSESKHNSKLDSKIKTLTKNISDAIAKQKALDEKALRTKEEAEAKIAEKTEALEEMKEYCIAESKENDSMKAQISKLRLDIEVAKAEQKALDAAKAQAADEARIAREQAEAKIEAQTEALERLEAQLKAEAKASSDLNFEVAKLETDKIELRKVLSSDRREKQKLIDDKTKELKRVEQSMEKLKISKIALKKGLKAQIDLLKKARTADQKAANRTIKAHTQELKNVEHAISRLKGNIAEAYESREEALANGNKSGAQAALQLQEKIESIRAVETFESDFEGREIETVRSELESVPGRMSRDYSIDADLQMASSRFSVLSGEETIYEEDHTDDEEETDDEGDTDDEASVDDLVNLGVMRWFGLGRK